MSNNCLQRCIVLDVIGPLPPLPPPPLKGGWVWGGGWGWRVKKRLRVYTATSTQHDITSTRSSPQVVTAEGSQVIKTDLTADNGLVHVIDKVIYPLPATNLPLTLTFDKDLGSVAYLILQCSLTMALSSKLLRLWTLSWRGFRTANHPSTLQPIRMSQLPFRVKNPKRFSPRFPDKLKQSSKERKSCGFADRSKYATMVHAVSCR